MITKFKLYEEVMRNPEVGDYLLCDEYNADDADEEVFLYTKTHVGQIIKQKNSTQFLVKYDIDFDTCGFTQDRFQFETDPNGVRTMNKNEIQYWSRNKEELEQILVVKKFNI